MHAATRRPAFSATAVLANMSHELRTPLNAIIGFTGTLLLQLPGPLNPDQQRQLRTVQNNAKQLLSLINDLLDLAKLEAGQLDLRLEPVALRSVVEEVGTALRAAAQAKGLDLGTEASAGDFVVQADRGAVSQILHHLVGNAIKFTKAGHVGLYLDRGRVNGHVLTTVRVVDSGIGIRPEDRAALFHAHDHVEPSARHRRKGPGLGLYLSHKLAQLLGARLTVESEMGKGSTFALQWQEPSQA